MCKDCTTHTAPAEHMDGGVAAALIEKEAEQDESAHIGPEGETDWHGLYLSENRRAEKAERRAELWKEAARRAVQTKKTYVQAATDLLRARRLSEQETRRLLHRANEAERERDEAREDRNDALHREKAEQDRAVQAERSRDLALARAERAECHDCVADAAVIREPRPLTSEDITDEMVARAVERYDGAKAVWEPRRAMREALTAALTEPPARPEGAEDVAVRLLQAGAAVGVEMTAEQRDALADHVAAMHVRVVGEEQS